MTRNTGYDRQNSILTKELRPFVDGVKEYNSRQGEYDAREKVKSRLRSGVLDFAFLYKLDESVRREVFAEMGPGDDLHHCLVLMGAFGCRAARDAGIDPEDYLSSVADALYGGTVVGINEKEALLESAHVEIHKEWRDIYDPDTIYEKFERGEKISAEELGHLAHSDKFDEEDFAEFKQRLEEEG